LCLRGAPRQCGEAASTSAYQPNPPESAAGQLTVPISSGTRIAGQSGKDGVELARFEAFRVNAVPRWSQPITRSLLGKVAHARLLTILGGAEDEYEHQGRPKRGHL